MKVLEKAAEISGDRGDFFFSKILVVKCISNFNRSKQFKIFWVQYYLG